MKKTKLCFSLGIILASFILGGCNNARLATPTPTITSTASPPLKIPTATPTETSVPEPLPETEEPIVLLTGTLEIRFPDPWGGVEFCSSSVPYELELIDNTYQLSGEGSFVCHQFETYELGFKQHLEQDYDVLLSGSMPAAPGSILEMNLQMAGFQDGYYTDMPPDVPEMITQSNPFHVEIIQTIALKFSYVSQAFCVWNDQGTFCNLPGEEPPLDKTGWLFILLPGE